VFSYQYDGNGRVTEQDNSDGTKDIYAYDAAGQLIRQQVVKDENIISYINYTYDEAGNVVSKESSQQDGNPASISSVTMTYDKANRIKTYNGEKVTYDKEGNMTYGPSTEGIMTAYTYNCRNQLIQADNVTYAYDAEGNRTAQIDLETGTRTEYVNNTNGELTQVVMEHSTCDGKTSTTTYVYGNGLLSQNSSDGYLTFHYNNIGSTIVVTNEEGEAEEQYTYGPYGEILSGDTSKTAYLYNGMYGVSTDANGLYYMRARYYNVSIKRFINQDIVNGSITNSQSLNKFSYVQGNPISLTDPFGLSPNISISGIGHAALDLLGIIPGFDFCDAINTAWYLKEGDYENAALSAAACIPLLGSVVGSGLKWGAKGVANAEKVADTVKLGSRIVGDGGAMLLSGGQAVESARQVYSNITNGEGITWKNAVDVITLGISVAGMGMAGASIAKSGKSLKAMYRGETAVSNVATSNATKGVSAAAESASDPYALLEGRVGFKATLSVEERAACDLVGLQMSVGHTTRVRHYTNSKGLKGIHDSGMIYAQDNNRVYMELAKKKPLSSIEAEAIYQLKPGKGKNYIEFDIDTDLLEWVENPRYHRMELTVKGDVKIKNAKFFKRNK